MDSPPLPVPVGSPPCTIKSYSKSAIIKQTVRYCFGYRFCEHILIQYDEINWILAFQNLKSHTTFQRTKKTKNKYLDDSVELDVVVIASAGKFDEVPASSRSVLVV